MKYIFDNCISFRYAAMLSALNEDVVALRDLCDVNISDIDLFAYLKDKGRVFVTIDDRQKTRVRESRALRDAGLTALWFGPFWDRKKFWDQARWLVNRWPIIDGFARGAVQGTCAEIKENGKAMAFSL